MEDQYCYSFLIDVGCQLAGGHFWWAFAWLQVPAVCNNNNYYYVTWPLHVSKRVHLVECRSPLSFFSTSRQQHVHT